MNLEALKESGVPELFAIVVSMAAFAVSLITVWIAFSKFREERQLRLKAEIRASLGPLIEIGPDNEEGEPTYQKYVLLVENMASATATNLVVELDGIAAAKHACTRNTKPIVPDRLPGRDSFTLDLYFRKKERGLMGSTDNPPRLLIISWADLSGLPGVYHKHLRFEGQPIAIPIEQFLADNQAGAGATAEPGAADVTLNVKPRLS